MTGYTIHYGFQLQVSSVGDTDSAFSTEAEVYPLASFPSPQPVVNGYHKYDANGEGVSGHEEEVDFNNKSASDPPFASPANSKRFVYRNSF